MTLARLPLALFALMLLAASASRADDAPKEQEVATVGVYLKELPGIDVKSNTYVADFY
jgi:hypothetical protein